MASRKAKGLQIVITDNGKRIGTMDTNKFMESQHHAHGSTLFLSDYVRLFNATKFSRNEPERVETEIC